MIKMEVCNHDTKVKNEEYEFDDLTDAIGWLGMMHPILLHKDTFRKIADDGTWRQYGMDDYYAILEDSDPVADPHRP